VHDVNILDQLVWEACSFYIMDRGHFDFACWHRIHQCGAFFVTRAKQNFRCARRYSRLVDKTTGLHFDQTVVMTGLKAKHDYPDPLRRIGYRDPQTGKGLLFLTNNFTVPALTIAKRGAHSNLNRHRRLSARRHFEKTSASGGQPLHDSTDFEPDAL
jgi:hypothetical protein